MVANGHLTEPLKPSFPGLDKFRGRVLHTHDYKVSNHFVRSCVRTYKRVCTRSVIVYSLLGHIFEYFVIKDGH